MTYIFMDLLVATFWLLVVFKPCCSSSVIDCQAVHAVTHLWPNVSWSQLQQDKKLLVDRWMDTAMTFIFFKSYFLRIFMSS